MLHGMETVLKRDLWPLTRETSLFLTPSTLGKKRCGLPGSRKKQPLRWPRRLAEEQQSTAGLRETGYLQAKIDILRAGDAAFSSTGLDVQA